MAKENQGYIVQTASGKQGVWLHSDRPDEAGRILVNLNDGTKIRTQRKNVTIIGFQD